MYVYQYTTNNYIEITENQLKKKYNFIKEREFRLFNSHINSDIAKISFNNQGIIIKLDTVSLILFKNDVLIFSLFKKKDNFIKFFKKNNYNKSNLFPLYVFELILIYLSDYIDSYLETCNLKFTEYNIDKFNSKQYLDILRFNHSLLLVQNNFKEVYENLDEKDKNNKYKKILFNNNDYLNDLDHIILIYKNQINEDIKNLERFIKQVEIFIDLANLKLSETRNKIAKKSIHINYIGLILNIGTFTSNIFGANLKSGLENYNYLLWILFGFNIITMIISYVLFGQYYKIKLCCK